VGLLADQSCSLKSAADHLSPRERTGRESTLVYFLCEAQAALAREDFLAPFPLPPSHGEKNTVSYSSFCAAFFKNSHKGVKKPHSKGANSKIHVKKFSNNLKIFH